MKERNFSLDIIRVLACIMVVFMHSPMPTEHANGLFLVALSYFTAPCIGLFFMVSGALLMPVKTDYFTFLRRRLSKIVIPTLIWTALYLALSIYYSKSEINIVQSMLSVPFSAQGHGVLWFMYTLTGLYLLAPILGAWIEKASVKEIECVLMLWCVTLCYPLIENFLIINTGSTGILYYFTGYAGYFLFGYYLKTYPRRLSIAIPTVIALSGIGLILFIKTQDIEFDFYRLFWYESIFIAALCCMIWIILQRISSGRRDVNLGGGILRNMTQISNLTFGVYLIHILIMRYCIWDFAWIRAIQCYPLQTIIIALITLMLSLVLCQLISRLPFSQWIIGYRNIK